MTSVTQLKETENGSIVAKHSDMEKTVYEKFQLWRDRKVFVDIGANIGACVLKCCSQQMYIIAFKAITKFV